MKPKNWIFDAIKRMLMLIFIDFITIVGDNLLALFPPAAILICSNPSKYKYEELQKASALALFKFMIMR